MNQYFPALKMTDIKCGLQQYKKSGNNIFLCLKKEEKSDKYQVWFAAIFHRLTFTRRRFLLALFIQPPISQVLRQC